MASSDPRRCVVVAASAVMIWCSQRVPAYRSGPVTRSRIHTASRTWGRRRLPAQAVLVTSWCTSRRAGQAAGDGTARWSARVRASTMVTAAATSTALTVIRMICQPGTPVAAVCEVVAGTGPKRPS